MNTMTAIRTVAPLIAAAGLLGPSSAQTTSRVSLSSAGTQGNFNSLWEAISANGRFVAFHSMASNLVPSDPNGHMPDIFLKDMQTAACTLVSVSAAGGGADWGSIAPSISGNGSCVAFESDATNLVAGDTNLVRDIFVRDLETGVTTRMSVDSTGVQANGPSYLAAISADGRYVAFESDATNLVRGDLNGVRDVFVHDRQTGLTKRVSPGLPGMESNGPSTGPTISADGRYVAYTSDATNLVPNDTNAQSDVFVMDRQTGTTVRVSVDSSGSQGDLGSRNASISGDGRVVMFESDATNLVGGDTNAVGDVFVHELASGLTQRVSVSSLGAQAKSPSFVQGRFQVSADGRFVAFDSPASDLVAGDTNGGSDCFLYDRRTGTQTRLSVTTAGAQAAAGSRAPAISADGRFAAFDSSSSNLVPGDNNLYWDVFLRDRGAASAFVAFCFGDGSGAACPCSNPGAAGHGCENSVGTGGAVLTAVGGATLAADSVQFTASGELASSLSLLLQGNAVVTPLHLGDGLRCAGGSLKRLYKRSATAGTIVVPAPGDPTVSSRSATLGDPIPVGATRIYEVHYRDPNPGFCPAPQGSTFNVTNAVLVAWGV